MSPPRRGAERRRRTGKTDFVCDLCAVFPSSNSGEVCHPWRICSPMYQSRKRKRNLSLSPRINGPIQNRDFVFSPRGELSVLSYCPDPERLTTCGLPSELYETEATPLTV